MNCFSAFFAIAAAQLAAFILMLSGGQDENQKAQPQAVTSVQPEVMEKIDRLTLKNDSDFVPTNIEQRRHYLADSLTETSLQPSFEKNSGWKFISLIDREREARPLQFQSLPVAHVASESRNLVGAVYQFSYQENPSEGDSPQDFRAVRYSF